MCQEKIYPCVFNFPKLRHWNAYFKKKRREKRKKNMGTDVKDWYRTDKKLNFIMILCAV